MKAHTRRSVSFIVATAVNSRSYSNIYDFEASEHFLIQCRIVNGFVDTYDYSQSCHINGALSQFYHYGNKSHITLSINGRSFSGYDYDTNQHFQGHVNEGSIQIYDHDTNQHYNFQVS